MGHSIVTAVKTLRGEVTEEDIKETKRLKLIEIICESLPQAFLSAVCIYYNGGILGNHEQGILGNIPEFVSCVLTVGNIIIFCSLSRCGLDCNLYLMCEC